MNKLARHIQFKGTRTMLGIICLVIPFSLHAQDSSGDFLVEEISHLGAVVLFLGLLIWVFILRNKLKKEREKNSICSKK